MSNAENKNLEFITDCLKEAGVDPDENNVILTGDSCVIIASISETANDLKHIVHTLCRQDLADMQRGLAIVNAVLKRKV